ncbi:hypothetical protein LMG33818_000073 [Halomonadaceae bacterium LMG 33818]|uniref:acyltransferase family protein n=1 Tax=Cernens ardua TaxID=3402176 RepID=UPI003EDC2240
MATTQSRGKIESIAMLRGLAIICIVYEHSAFSLWNKLYSGGLANFLFTQFIPRWTAIFVFISGFLFYYLSDRYRTKKYYFTKFKNVLVPYLVISALSYLLLAQHQLAQLSIGFSDPSHNVFIWVVKSLVFGSFNTPLWFIPMIIMIFALGPWLYRISRENLVFIAIASLIFVNFYHRPPYTYGPILNAVFFLPYYIVGMCVCQHKQWILDQGWKHYPMLICLTLFTFLVSTLRFFHFNVYPWISYDDNLQIFLLGLIFFVLFEKINIPNGPKRLLIRVGETSFATFFIHYLFVVMFVKILFAHENLFAGIIHTTSGTVTFLTYSAICFMTVAICHFIAVLLKKIFGRYSRYMIGY